MKALVVSDTHGRADRLEKALLQAGAIDMLIHCGDGAADVERVRALAPCILQVRGNCDWNAALPTLYITDEQRVRIFLCHGHEYGVKTGYRRIIAAAQQQAAQVVCFGHTHVPLIQRQGALLLVNPGALSARDATFALLSAENGRYDATTRYLL
ncbi:MAG: YfcE family phosphodiesterase [Eubacteriales bacterium]|nr:YfcE family phosphodiesterase [Eubacteriales bacterium]